MSQEATIQTRKTISNFTDIHAWQHAHKLSIGVYKSIQHFPKEEIFSLTRQIRRACVSIESNIAEGFGRRTSKDRLHFYDMARGSVNELHTQLLLARDIKYLSEENFDLLAIKIETCQKLLSGLIKATKGV
jgi:four helix bundle protein